MPKILIIIILAMCIYSCAGDEEPALTEEVETIDESAEEVSEDELPEAISEDIQQDEINLDSAKSLCKEMEEFYLDLTFCSRFFARYCLNYFSNGFRFGS